MGIIRIDIPDGRRLLVTTKDVAGSYPGFYITCWDNGAEEMIACVEYNSDEKEIRTEVYKQGADEPIYIIDEFGEDHM